MLNALEISGIIGIVFFSIVLHEVSHGAVAFAFGDPTAKAMGRLTLNPLRHVDPVGTVFLPLALYLFNAGVIFGWAKPVPFDPRYFKHRSLGTLLVALAGPATNILLAFAFALILRSAGKISSWAKLALLGLGINLFLALFNLIPVPPLDGSKILGAALPQAFKPYYYSLERVGIVLIMILLFTGILFKWLWPVYGTALRWLTNF